MTRVALAFTLPLLLLLGGCGSAAEPSAEMRARLDSMDATEVVRAYFESGDEGIEVYLSRPGEAERRAEPNVSSNRERSGGVDDLRVEGGEDVGDRIDDPRYPEQRQFVVSYVSRRRSPTGERPGPRMFFVYAGRDAQGRWKVLEYGTGP